jgi:hypothetical protein
MALICSNTQSVFCSRLVLEKEWLFSMHPVEDLGQHFALPYNKYFDVQMQELLSKDQLCKTFPVVGHEICKRFSGYSFVFQLDQFS